MRSLRKKERAFLHIPVLISDEPKISELIPVADEKFRDDIIAEAQTIQEILCQNGIQPKEVHYDDKQQLILYFANNRVMLEIILIWKKSCLIFSL